MSKSREEVAGDITIAWLNALGSAVGGSVGPVAVVAKDILQSTDKITKFYDKTYRQLKTTEDDLYKK